ncbi:MAG TPA: 5'/3'-nucleotidase SurE [Acidimicrobiales bacterium]|nr:5'/3'-nucleotidase SurE [Acidimicrobiales bacterium]
MARSGRRVLVTNDDGWRSPGVAALARALADDGHDVVLAAPVEDMSGSGAAIGPLHSDAAIAYEDVEIPGLDDIPCYAVEGPPAVAVMAARLGGFGDPPDLIASGINPGPNTGRSTLHSGTVGAALTAANFGASGMAVSLGVGDPIHWDTAARVAVLAARWLVDAPATTVLNVNVPNLPAGEVAGVRLARLAAFGTVRAAITGSGGGKLQIELRATNVTLKPDTDTATVLAGMVAITPLVGIRTAGLESDVAEILQADLLGGA